MKKKETQKKATARKERPETPAKDQKPLLEGSPVNGVLDTPNSVFNYLRKKEFPYAEATFHDYQKKLQALNLADLQRHAIEVANIIPNTMERGRLVKRLEDEYLQKHGKYMVAFTQKSIGTSEVSPEAAQNIQNLLNARFKQ